MELLGAANVSTEAEKDAISAVPEMKFSNNSSSPVHPGGNNDAGKTEQPCEKMKGKNKSLSAPFAVNMDQLVSNVAGSFDDKGCILSRASKNDLRCTFTRAGENFSSNMSDDMKLQISKSASSLSHGEGEEEPDSLSLKKLQLEPTLPIYLKDWICMQDDVVSPYLTVEATLTYATLLRLPNTLTRQQKKERAADVISALGLERCQDTILGGKYVKGVSGGERKRVYIGNEILINPSLLFLDEPTSGLDSRKALRIVQMLENFAEAGKTVVPTIHQPSSRLFSKFDTLILLGKGNLLYSGKASEAMEYFYSIGCSPLITMNPAEFLIDLANGNVNDKSFPSELEVKFLPGSKRNENVEPSPVDVHEANGTRVAKLEKRKLLKPVVVEDEIEMQGTLNSRGNQATWCEQLSILLRRGITARRYEYLSCLCITQVISTAIIIGLLWFGSDSSSPNQLQDQAGLPFFISVFWGFFHLFTAVFTFPQERAMLIKERSVNMYKLSAYFLARTICDLPLDLILPAVFLVIVYLMVGLKPSSIAFSLTTLTVFLSIVAVQGLGLFIGAAFVDVKKATSASITVMTFMLSGAFFLQDVPLFMSWLRYISFNYHSYRLLLKIQYSCDSHFISELRLDHGGIEVGAMIAMVIGYRLLAYLFLRRMSVKTMA